MLKEKQNKPYMFLKLWLKCFLNITISWFGFCIFEKIALCSVQLLFYIKSTARQNNKTTTFTFYGKEVEILHN